MIVTPAEEVPQTGACGVKRAVRLETVILDGGRRVKLVPPAVLACRTAEAVADWVRTDLAPLADRLGSPLASLAVADSYSCRPRNRRAGAKLSAHGNGLAIDLAAMTLADRRVFPVVGNRMPLSARQAVKASACARFGTVLGPGSDGYHESHLHVDLIPRRPGRGICEWNLDASAKSP
ncbi:extensin family protein [Chelatococcus sp. GCM10030263]|uniref:extensin family protein n=1 Tax=Chelatococcus sp. GCM10030263 TaxID=3273387 RepID=UPI00360BF413